MYVYFASAKFSIQSCIKVSAALSLCYSNMSILLMRPRTDQKENIPVLVKRFLNCNAIDTKEFW
jgi:hypothetical protein